MPISWSSKKGFQLALIVVVGVGVGVALWLTGDTESAPLRIAVGVGLALLVYLVINLARAVGLHSDFSMNLPNWGLAFSALAFVVAILSFSSGNNLLYLLLSILLATMFVSLLAARLSLSRLNVALKFPDHIFVEEAAAFTVEVTNDKRLLPSFSLTAWSGEQADDSVHSPLGYFPIIPAQTTARACSERRYARRGVYRVGGLLIVTRFPFGFIEQRRFIAVNGELAVYPQPLALDELEPLLPVVQGRVQGRAKGAGSDLYALRAYVPSDHRRLIDWKATARTTQLMVREFHRDDDWQVTIAFDNRAAAERMKEPTFAEQFERAVRVAAGLAEQFLAAGAEVRLLACKKSSGFGTDQQHFYAILRLLARLQPKPVTPANQSIDAQQKAGPQDEPESDEDEGCQSLRDEQATDNGLRILLTARADQADAAAHVIKFDAL